MPIQFDTRRDAGVDPIVTAALAGQQLGLAKRRQTVDEQQAAAGLAALNQRLQREGTQEQRQATEFGQQQQALGAIGDIQAQQQEPGADHAAVLKDFLGKSQKVMSPQAFALMAPEAVKATHESIIRDKVTDVSSKLQNTLIGLKQTPGVEQFASELEPYISELDMVGAMDPREAAPALDNLTHRIESKIGIIREFKQQNEDKLTAIATMQQQIDARPLGDPFRTQLQVAKSALELNLVKPIEAYKLLRMQEAGYQEIAPGVWVDPTKYAGFQQRGQQAQAAEKGRNDRFQQKQAEDERRNRANEDLRRADQDLRLKIEGFKGRNGNKPLTKQEIKAGAIQLMDVSQYSDHPFSETEAVQKIVDMEKQIDEIRGREQPATGGAPASAQPVAPTKPPPGFMDDYEKLPEAEKAKVRAMKPEWFPGGK